MICYLCGHLCDYSEHGACEHCYKKINDLNLKVYAKSLLAEASEYCPLSLRRKIENFLGVDNDTFLCQT